jgi:hypothetical protein
VFEALYGPLGPARGDHQAAIVAATVAAVFGDGQLRPEAFLPPWSRPDTPQGAVEADPGSGRSPEQLLAVARAITRQLGGDA